jgi:hypothetical protein
VDIQAFTDRRARLLKAMGRGIAVIPTAPERVRNRDSHYPYRHDSYFYYLRLPEPEACVVLVAGDAPRSLLFCREKDPRRKSGMASATGPKARARRSASTRLSPSAASTQYCRTARRPARAALLDGARRRTGTTASSPR